MTILRDDLRSDEAILNITWDGQNGDLGEPISYSSSDSDIKAWASEAIRGGSVSGIRSDGYVDFEGFIVDRYRANEDKPYNSVFLRPKTPFGTVL